MNLMIALLALAQQPEAPKPAAPVVQGQAEDLESLQRKRLVKEAERHNLRSLIQEAKEKKEEKEAKRYASELETVEQELVALDAAIEEKRKESAASWGKTTRLEGQVLLTHWDNDLELKDSFGWGGTLHLADPIYLTYRRWEPRDELGNESASVQAYEMGFHWQGNAAKDAEVTFTFGTGFGLVHLESDASGSDSDTGWFWSVRQSVEWQFSAKGRFTVGAGMDLMRTDFNNERTHTFHSFSAEFALEFRL